MNTSPSIQLTLLQGKGETLESIGKVLATIDDINDVDELSELHKLLYGSIGIRTVRRRHIKQFSGWPEGTDLAKKREYLAKQKKAVVLQLARALKLSAVGERVSDHIPIYFKLTTVQAEIESRLVDFLDKPNAAAVGKA